MDAVRLKNMKFFAFHGNIKAEAEIGQRFEVDVELRGSLKMAAISDDLKDTYDYNRIYAAVHRAVTGSRFHLIEALAEEVSRNILKDYPSAQVTVTIRKPQIAVDGILDCAEVIITRGPLQDNSVGGG